MLKRFLAASIAFAGTVVAVATYYLLSSIAWGLPWAEWIQLGMATALVGFSSYLFVRRKSWPSFLLLIGSIPILLLKLSFCDWVYRMGHGLRSPALVFLFPATKTIRHSSRCCFIVSY